LIERVQTPQLRELATKLGSTTEDLDEIAKDWKEWTKRENASIAMMHGEIIIQM
jgi:hypothetical protein